MDTQNIEVVTRKHVTTKRLTNTWHWQKQLHLIALKLDSEPYLLPCFLYVLCDYNLQLKMYLPNIR